MEQIGYSLIDANGGEVQRWGDTIGQCAGVPDVIRLPNGDFVHCPALGALQDWRLVPRFAGWGSPASISFDGTRINVVKVVPIPDTVTNYQARAALIGAGLFDSVNTAMLALPAASIERQAWEYANTFSRQSPIIEALGAQLSLSNEQIDGLFTAAAQVT